MVSMAALAAAIALLLTINDVGATHQMTVAHKWDWYAPLYLHRDWGDDWAHPPAYEFRGYGLTGGTPDSYIDYVWLSVKSGVSCDTAKRGAMMQASSLTRIAPRRYPNFSGAWSAIPSCDSYPKYAIVTDHYVESWGLSRYIYVHCWRPENMWWWPC